MVAVKDDDSNWGTEGVYWQIADFFEEDSCYQITCYVRYVGGSNAAETSIQFELATGLNAVTSFSNLNCTDPPATPSTSQQIGMFLDSDLTSGTWQLVTVFFRANDDYDQLYIYTDLTGTPSSGETSSDFYIDLVTVDKMDLDADFSFSPDPGCVNSSIQFTNLYFQGGQGASHSWDFGDQSSSTEADPTHTYTSGGDYQVTHIVSVPNCAPDTVTKTVSVLELADASFTYSGELICDEYCIAYDGEAGGTEVTFEWDFGAYGVNNTDLDPAICYLSDGTYGVTFTVTNSCGEDEDIQNVVINSSDFDYDLEIGIDASSENDLSAIISANSLPADQLGNIHWQIHGKLVIDQDYEFSPNVRFQMMPGSVIELAQNMDLTFDDAHLYGCDTLWKGIRALAFSRLSLKNSIIQDAEYAVEPFTKCKLDITNTTFDKNFVGIYKVTNTINDGFNLLPFYGNTFDCSGDLLAPYDGQPSSPGSKTFAGIQLEYPSNYAGLFVLGTGVFGSNLNHFKNLRNGIISTNVGWRIAETDFSGLTEDEEYSVTGFGIRATSESGAHLFQQFGLYILGPASFSKIDNTAIYVRGMAVDRIMWNKMEQVHRGVNAIGTVTETDIRENLINAQQQGIGLFQIDANTDLRVYNNFITMEGQKSSAIRLDQSGITPSDLASFLIDFNTIDLQNNNSHGIFLQKDFNTRVLNNDIEVTAPSQTGKTYFGIRLDGSFNDVLCNNEVIGNGNWTDGNFGIRSMSAETTEFLCNSLEDTRTGVFFAMGGMIPELFQGNSMEGHFYGLHLDPSGVIGEQESAGNRWIEGTYSSSGVKAKNEAEDLFGLEASAFSVFSSTAPLFPTDDTGGTEGIEVETGLSDGDWFEQSFIEDFTCPENPCGDFEEFAPDIDTALHRIDTLIARDSTLNSTFHYEINWLGKDYLFRKLVAKPSIMTSYSFLDTFYQRLDTLEIGKLRAINEGLRSLYAIPTSINNTIIANVENMTGWSDDIHFQDSLYVLTSDTTYLNSRDSLLALISEATEENDSLWTIVWDHRDLDADTLATENSNISPDSTYGEKEKLLNDIFLSTIPRNTWTFTGTQIDSLEVTAGLCPVLAGEAVFHARSLLAMIGRDSLYNDDEICDSAFERQLKDKGTTGQEPALNLLAVYPNPTSGTLHIYWGQNTPEKVFIYNSVGEAAQTLKPMEHSTGLETNMAKLAPGVYFVRAFKEGETYKVAKLMLIR